MNELVPSFLKSYKYSRKKMCLPEPEYGYYEGSVVDLIDGPKGNYLKGLISKARMNNQLVGFIAGPPCPDFSVGGKNRGRDGQKGQLSEVYFNLIEKHRPDYFLFENVKGLWRTKRHREFYEELKKQAIDTGYVLTERLINSIEYGVPQDRDRILLIGFHKRVLNNKFDKFDGVMADGLFPWKKMMKYNKADVFKFDWPGITPFREDSEIPIPKNIPLELTVEHWFNKNDVYKHPNSQHCFRPRNGLRKFKTILEGDDKKKSYKRLHRWRYSPTAAYGNNEVHLHPYKARRISVAEALSIQSLPKEFELPPDVSLSDMFKMIGNGVPLGVSKGIAETIKLFVKENK